TATTRSSARVNPVRAPISFTVTGPRRAVQRVPAAGDAKCGERTGDRAGRSLRHTNQRGAEAPQRLFPWIRPMLELEANGKLGLPRIAHTNAQKAVEIEQGGRGQRVNVVLVVEGIKDFHLGNDGVAFAEAERPRDAKVKREERIVLA